MSEHDFDLRPAPPRPVRRLALCCALGAALAVAAALSGQAPFLGVKILDNGHVGIGTESPEARLHVAGDALVTGVLSGQNFLGKYGSAAVIRGFSASGTSQTPFVIVYDDSNPNRPPKIILINAATRVFKNFVIDHPLDPARYLVHATLEGPEGAVYYRGSARLANGRAEVELPRYFEALTRRAGRTVQLTNVDGFDALAVETREGERIRDGRFVVVSRDPASAQAFDWEVKAVRADAPPLEAEPRRDSTVVGGFGPYTFIAGRRP
jgi:hypothetical protein